MKIVWLSLLIALVITYLLFFLVPQGAELFSLNYKKIFSGKFEFYRFVTYQFAHLNLKHLLINILTLTITFLLLFELKLSLNKFLILFLAAGFFAVLPLWFLLKFDALGASTAIFAGMGFLTLGLDRYGLKPGLFVLGLFFLVFYKLVYFLFSGTFIDSTFQLELNQSLSHFSGLVFGLLGYFGTNKLKRIISKRKSFILRRC